jgi:hypothetical protein
MRVEPLQYLAADAHRPPRSEVPTAADIAVPAACTPPAIPSWRRSRHSSSRLERRSQAKSTRAASTRWLAARTLPHRPPAPAADANGGGRGGVGRDGPVRSLGCARIGRCGLEREKIWRPKTSQYLRLFKRNKSTNYLRSLFCMHFRLGHGFFPICTLYLKWISDMFENFKQKCFVYISMFYVSTKAFKKPNFLCGYVKMTNFGTKISLFATYFLSFLSRPRKYPFFTKLLRR